MTLDGMAPVFVMSKDDKDLVALVLGAPTKYREEVRQGLDGPVTVQVPIEESSSYWVGYGRLS